MIDPVKARREGMRWNILNTLHKAAPYSYSEVLLLDVMRGIYPDSTQDEVRKHLDYLEARELVTLTKQPSGLWFSDIDRYGVDIVEYTVECEPGIARPPRYGIA